MTKPRLTYTGKSWQVTHHGRLICAYQDRDRAINYANNYAIRKQYGDFTAAIHRTKTALARMEERR